MNGRGSEAGSHGSLRRCVLGPGRAGAPRDVGEGLPQPVDRMRCLPFLSKVEQATASRRPDFHRDFDREMVTVAGLCRTLTGFAGTQCVVGGTTLGGYHHPPPISRA